MGQEKTSYQKTMAVMKANLSRALAVTLMFLSVLLLLVMLGLLAEWSAGFFFHRQVQKLIMVSLMVAGVFLVILPLELGIKRWFYELCFQEDASLTEIFFFFEKPGRYIKSVWFRLQMTVRRLAAYIVFLLPWIIVELFSWALIPYGESWQAVCSILSAAALVLGLIFGFLRNLRFYLADYLLFSDLSCHGSKAANISTGLMKTKQRELAGTFLSLFPFYLVSLFVVPLLLLIPVLYTLTAVKAIEFLKQDQKTKNMFSGIWYSGSKEV
ncbi:MAG: hypothetical protein ACOX60_07930 [Massiliimalia sp.]|jgi:hypothetical protein